jgi:hypothetical protein
MRRVLFATVTAALLLLVANAFAATPTHRMTYPPSAPVR